MGLEDQVGTFDVSQRTELEGFSVELFDDSESQGRSAIDQKTNIENEELGLCLINTQVWNLIEMPELDPSRTFKRLASSRKGWKVEKLSEAARGRRENVEKRGVLDTLKGMFSRRKERRDQDGY